MNEEGEERTDKEQGLSTKVAVGTQVGCSVACRFGKKALTHQMSRSISVWNIELTAVLTSNTLP